MRSPVSPILFAVLGLAALGFARPVPAQTADHARAIALYDSIRAAGPDAADAAARILDRASRERPLDLATLRDLGGALFWTSQEPAAITVLERAVAFDPGAARAWKALGDARAMAADPDAALAAYRRARDAAPADTLLDPDARARLARSAATHATFVERAGLYGDWTGAYRRPGDRDGVWVFRYDPYLALFPTILDAATGEYRVLYPTDDPRALVYHSAAGDGRIELADGSRPTLRWTDPGGATRVAERVPIETRPVRVERPDVSLSGSLLLPAGDGPRAGVALLHGGGVLTRYHLMNEAWLFAAHGLAVIVWDKRGTGRSRGVDWTRVGLDALVGDAEAMIGRLRAEPGIDPARVGAWGHSQGGWLVPLVAARDPRLAFAILASGPATGVHRQAIDAVRARMRAAGRPDTEVAAAVDYMERLFARIEGGADVADLAPMVDAARSAPWSDWVMKPEAAFEPRWWKANDYEPTDTLRRLDLPVLALYGGADTTVPPTENPGRMADDLAAAPTGDATVALVPGADHTLMTADDRFSPLYLRTMVDWLAARGLAGP